jgi:hypothetical protein
MDYDNEIITLSTGEQLAGSLTKDAKGRPVFIGNAVYKTDDEKWNKMKPFENVDWLTISKDQGKEIMETYHDTDYYKEICESEYGIPSSDEDSYTSEETYEYLENICGWLDSEKL